MLGGVPPPNNEALALLTVVTDPEKYRARIEKLNASEQAAAAQLDEARELHRQAVDARTAADKARAEASALCNRIETELRAREQAVSAKAGNLAAKEAELASRERALAVSAHDRETALVQREKAAATQEAEVLATQQRAARDAEAAKNLRSDYEAKAASIRDFAKSLT